MFTDFKHFFFVLCRYMMYTFLCHTWKLSWWYGFNLKLVWHLKLSILIVHLMLSLCPSNAFPLETCVLLNLWCTKSTECQTLNVTEKSLDYVQCLGKALNATRSVEKDLRTLGWTFFVLTLVCYLTDDSPIFLTVYFWEEHEHFQCSSQQLTSALPKSQMAGISLNLSVYSLYKQRFRGPPWEVDV